MTRLPVAMAMKVMIREFWTPQMVRVSTSRPAKSVPIQWLRLGLCLIAV